MTPCSVDGCENTSKARDMCPGHYHRWHQGKPTNDTPLGTSFRTIPLEDRFWARVEKTDTCWLWTGPLYDGYGRIKADYRHQKAHRLAYTWAYGPIPDDLQVDHICRVRHCVNPDHLQVVPQALNAQNKGVRSDSQTGVRGVKWDEKWGRYTVRAMGPDGKRASGGGFKTLAEAEAAAIALRNRLMTNNLQDRRPA